MKLWHQSVTWAKAMKVWQACKQSIGKLPTYSEQCPGWFLMTTRAFSSIAALAHILMTAHLSFIPEAPQASCPYSLTILLRHCVGAPGDVYMQRALCCWRLLRMLRLLGVDRRGLCARGCRRCLCP